MDSNSKADEKNEETNTGAQIWRVDSEDYAEKHSVSKLVEGRLVDKNMASDNRRHRNQTKLYGELPLD